MKREHILVIRFQSLGDIAMTVPVVYTLARTYPNLRITMLSVESVRPLFEDLAPNVSFMSVDIRKDCKSIIGLNSLFRRLIAKNFTAVADLHNVHKSKYLRLRFIMGRYNVAHINRHKKGRRHLTKFNHKKLIKQHSSFQNYADVFAKLGYPLTLGFQSIFPKEGGNLNLLPKVVGPKKNFELWIGVAPLATHQNKIYPVKQMEQVLLSLVAKYPKIRFFLFGRGVKEERLFKQWCARIEQCLDTGAHLENMHQELILMSHLDLMISMDSANMHLASICGIPVVSIWGATHPYIGLIGWGQNEQNAVQIDLACRPCSIHGGKSCMRKDYACMRNIPPEQIIQRVEFVLAKRGKLLKNNI